MIWKTVNAEIERGEASRAAGNEGQARVSARRAAGMLLREYLEQRGENVTGLSSYDLIEIAHASAGYPADLIELLSHFLKRVEHGGAFPEEIDLLADVRRLAEKLGIPPESSPTDMRT